MITFIRIRFFLVLLLVPAIVLAQASESDLAKKTQNPVSDLISVPFQSNFNFGVGPEDELQYVLNIQPVLPMSVGEKWNWIHRTIVPLVYQPKLADDFGDEFGLGDIQYQGYLSPKAAGKFIWGVGPVVNVPSSTDESLGSEKWSAGPGIVGLVIDGPWVVGGVLNNIWSFAGTDNRSDVNLGVFQYFVNYNLKSGLYFTSAPVNTIDWEADSGNRVTIPLGGGVGKIFRVGNLPINTQLQTFYNLEKPENAADWSVRFQFQFLFPK